MSLTFSIKQLSVLVEICQEQTVDQGGLSQTRLSCEEEPPIIIIVINIINTTDIKATVQPKTLVLSSRLRFGEGHNLVTDRRIWRIVKVWETRMISAWTNNGDL